MDVSKGPSRGRQSVADFRRDLIRKITDKTVAELAQEMGISPADRPRWSMVVKRTRSAAAILKKSLAPAGGGQAPSDIEEPRGPAGKQPVVLRIDKKGKAST